MLIVDAQIHLWSKGTTLPPHRAAPYLMEEALRDMDAAGVDRALIHPPSWDPDSNELAVEAVRAHPERFAILGRFPPERLESRLLVPEWKSRPGMLGLRFTFLQPHMKSWPTDGTMDWLWPACEKAQIPIALMASNFLPTVAKVAERHPGLRLIIDHFGRARGGKDDAAFANVSEVAALAKFPNVALKATGAAGESSEPYPFRNIHKYIQQLYDAFGPQRFFWGTDITRMPCSWLQCVTMFTEELPWLKGNDLELVMGRAVCDWLDWKLA
jgi:predicted TIM-barrel fold metal-dependent hydrolase